MNSSSRFLIPEVLSEGKAGTTGPVEVIGERVRELQGIPTTGNREETITKFHKELSHASSQFYDSFFLPLWLISPSLLAVGGNG